MHEAVRLALKQNPRLLAAGIEALESKQGKKVARSVFLPKAALGLEEANPATQSCDNLRSGIRSLLGWSI